MIAVALVIEGVQSVVPGLVHAKFTPGEVLLNMVYLQGIAGVPSVLAVAWTLCLEVQFYLVVVIVALSATRLSSSPTARTRIQVGVVSALMLLSLLLGLLGVSSGPYVIGTWWMFAIGMILACFVAGLVRLWFVVSALAVLLFWGSGGSRRPCPPPHGRKALSRMVEANPATQARCH